MAVSGKHIRLHQEILGLDGVLKSPTLIFGYQEVRIHPGQFASHRPATVRDRLARLRLWLRGFDINVPDDYRCDSLGDVLRLRGIASSDTLDLYDSRATLRLDMNESLPAEYRGRYNTVIDIGSLEHVFDTRQCLANVIDMMAVDGHYVLHTAVNGYYSHGLHVFNPLGLQAALTLNGLETVYKRYSTRAGRVIDDPARARDVIMWIVARKVCSVERFTPPQQDYWEAYYAEANRQQRKLLQRAYWRNVK